VRFKEVEKKKVVPGFSPGIANGDIGDAYLSNTPF
jgi:hypothetical protein